jgi:DNA-binding beta-propeller fold protein YncE
MKLRRFAALFCVCYTVCLHGTYATEAPRLDLITSISLPAISGGDFDHFAVDLAHSKLYVAAEKYGSIETFSLPDGRHIGSNRSVAVSPHKIELIKNGSALMVADAGASRLEIVDTGSMTVEKRIPLLPQPDSGILDARTGVFYIGNGGVQSKSDHAYISMLSTRTESVVGRVRVPAGQIKGMAIDPQTGRLFINLRDVNKIGIIDTARNKLIGTWNVPGPSRNSAMTLDSEHRRLFIGSRRPGKLYVLNADTGRIEQTLDITDISDEMAVDPANACVYIAGEGGLDVIRREQGGNYAKVQHVDTRGGKTFAFVPEYKRLYVIHTKGPQASQAGLQIFDTH